LKIGKEIPIFIKNGAVLHFKKKKGGQELGTVHFLPHQAARVADFQACFRPRLDPKSNKTCTNMST
jgi:hypothetical protein